MYKKVAIGALIFVALAATAGLWGTPVSLIDVLIWPLETLSPWQFQNGFLEASENVEPVQDATLRLLKPLGHVRLLRRFPPVSSADKHKPKN